MSFGFRRSGKAVQVVLYLDQVCVVFCVKRIHIIQRVVIAVRHHLLCRIHGIQRDERFVFFTGEKDFIPVCNDGVTACGCVLCQQIKPAGVVCRIIPDAQQRSEHWNNIQVAANLFIHARFDPRVVQDQRRHGLFIIEF